MTAVHYSHSEDLHQQRHVAETQIHILTGRMDVFGVLPRPLKMKISMLNRKLKNIEFLQL